MSFRGTRARAALGSGSDQVGKGGCATFAYLPSAERPTTHLASRATACLFDDVGNSERPHHASPPGPDGCLSPCKRESRHRTRTGDPFITRERRVRDARPLAGTSGHVYAANDPFLRLSSGRTCLLVPALVPVLDPATPSVSLGGGMSVRRPALGPRPRGTGRGGCQRAPGCARVGSHSSRRQAARPGRPS